MNWNWHVWAIALKNGESQKKAAKRLGISEGSLTRMIFDNAAPSIVTLEKIAEKSKTTVWQLMKEVHEISSKKAEKFDDFAA